MDFNGSLPDGLSGADALAAALGAETCDMDGMDEKVWQQNPLVFLTSCLDTSMDVYIFQLAGCLEDLTSRVKMLEQAVLSGEGTYLIIY